MTTTRTQVLKIGLLVFALFALACSEVPATGETSFTPFMTPEDEARIGRKEHKWMIAEHGGVYVDPRLQGYLEEIGGRMVQASGDANQRFKFTVLNSIDGNAYSVPGGYVYVTRGLLALLGDEAELAGILGHEIAHMTARHAAREFSRQTASSVSFMILSVLTAGLSEIAERGTKYYFRSYSRDQEREADALGLTYLHRANYDPKGLQRALERMRKYIALINGLLRRDQIDEESWLASHPAVNERVLTLEKAIAGSPSSRSATVGRDAYLDRIDQLPLFFNSVLGSARVHIIEIQRKSSAADLTGDFPVADGERWIEVLNGLSSGDRLQPGDRVKVISYDRRGH